MPNIRSTAYDVQHGYFCLRSGGTGAIPVLDIICCTLDDGHIDA
jgi:hypothetical protein